MNNTKEAQCKVCGRTFTKRTKATGHALKNGERPANAVTCGQRTCSQKNTDNLRRKNYLNNSTEKKDYAKRYYRKVYIPNKIDINARRRARYNANVEAIRLKKSVN